MSRKYTLVNTKVKDVYCVRAFATHEALKIHVSSVGRFREIGALEECNIHNAAWCAISWVDGIAGFSTKNKTDAINNCIATRELLQGR